MKRSIATNVTMDGLATAEADRRLLRDGYNEIAVAGRGRRVLRHLEVLREPMFGLLIGAGVLYALIGEPADAAVLGIFATFSVSITIIQRGRSDRVLAALQQLSAPRALVIRDGIRQRIPGRNVVIGDVLVVNEGDRVPADATLITGEDVMADESLLTGESMPVRKQPAAVPAGLATPGGEDLPHLYSGSLIVRGSGVAVTTATGVRAEVGRIHAALGQIRPARAGLEAETRRWVTAFALLGLAVSSLAVLVHGLMRGNWLEALLAGVALAMSLLPEELPLVFTVFTVMGAWRLARSRVLTRRPAAIETLGAATVLCTDKTGTLTLNRMSVACLRAGAEVWNAGSPLLPASAVHQVLQQSLLAVRPDAVDPMDQAIVALASQQGTGNPAGMELIRTIPLRSARPVFTQVWRESDGRSLVAAKGAPEAVARSCGLDGEDLASALAEARLLASQGIRVLGVASGELPQGAGITSEPEELRLQWRGLVGFADPLRESVPAAIAACHGAGVRVVMITGDHPATAAAIAQQAGIPAATVLTGADMDALDSAALDTAIRSVCVFARIRPEQKLRLVEALKAQGHVVGMTGDGVNDAPALKAAHIGIAMGSRGTDVAREAATLVLLDDDFSALAGAVRLGRRIYDNIGKAIGYVLAVHVPIAGIALLPILLGTSLVLNPMLIALLELLIDPACSVVFEVEPAERDVMRRRPRDPSAPLVTARFALRSLAQGAVAFAVVAAVYLWQTLHDATVELTRGTTLLMLLIANICLVLSHRSLVPFAVSTGRRNAALGWGLLVTIPVLAAAFVLPAAQDLFGIVAPPPATVLLCLVGGVVLWLATQVVKKFASQSRPA